MDTAINAMQNGKLLSDTQLARANAAMQSLTGNAGANSPWSRQPAAEWADTKNQFFSGLFSPAANQTGSTVDFGGIDTPKLIMFPTGSELEALKNTAAGSNAVLFPAGNNIATAQNGQLALDSQISSSADHWTKAQDHDILNKTEKDAPYYEKAGGCI